ncbi:MULTISPECIES: lysophospholipid acyltransferase family protein [unclassified Agrococcus]|uniref:lysophospholipid acyltransferase family protein n=1 Tax=unclassified Agrococcus TaxID=2615065 RepID=UPI00361CFBB5
MFNWLLKHWIVGPYILTVFRPWIKGMEHIPATGPVIIAGNHLSFIDSVLMPLVVRRRVYFLAKSEYFTGRGLKGAFVRWFFLASGQLPIDRSGGKASEASLESGLRVLARGDVLGIYPEGTRSPDGKLYRGRTGIARMVLEGQVPVVPCVMIGTEQIMPTGTFMPKVGRVGIVFGEPLDFSRYYGLDTDRFVLRSVTDEIMYALARLSDQEYVDVYASSAKAKRTDARPTPARPAAEAASA